MIDKNLKYAVVGASADPNKYGHKVFKDLLESGHSVIPINPKGGVLLGQTVYKSLGDYEASIDVAVFVVQPEVTVKVIQEAFDKKVNQVWMQPGSESDAAIELCKKLEIGYVANACIMIERRLNLI